MTKFGFFLLPSLAIFMVLKCNCSQSNIGVDHFHEIMRLVETGRQESVLSDPQNSSLRIARIERYGVPKPGHVNKLVEYKYTQEGVLFSYLRFGEKNESIVYSKVKLLSPSQKSRFEVLVNKVKPATLENCTKGSSLDGLDHYVFMWQYRYVNFSYYDANTCKSQKHDILLAFTESILKEWCKGTF